MRRNKIIVLLIFIILLTACNRIISSDENNKENQNTSEEINLLEDRLVISTSTLNMDSDEALETVKIIEKDNYKFIVEFTEVQNDVIKSENRIELIGKVNSVSQVDITNDGNTDILISADEGGSIGSTIYYYLSYKDNKLVSMDLSEIINEENYDFEFDKDGVNITGNNIDEYIKFNNRVLSTLEELEVSIASEYEVLPAIFSFSNTYNHEVIITAKRLLIVEHKLNSVAEIRTDYVFSDGWKKIKTIIAVVD
ncbi:hypothetical protein QE109_02230 [Fusibacter bizertensis]|uniref:Lipoprotein n=1 Tax=Fusibacter bizertensis TaxID=1488331 RepID=A0ABT6N964_9FIRM|nr:hypothetical protein [Fusibacter bizertensis]MDH8676944.1 hypothetical protein [Fusibacter bizertensis]